MPNLKTYIEEAISSGKSKSRLMDINEISTLEEFTKFLDLCGYHQIDMISSKDMLDMFDAKENVYCFYKLNRNTPMDVQVFVGGLFCVYRFPLDKHERYLEPECYWNKLKYGQISSGSVTPHYAMKMIRDYA